LSRFACQFRSAFTSCPSIVAVGDEVTMEAEIATWEEENDAKMRMMIYLNMTSKAAIELDSCLCAQDAVSLRRENLFVAINFKGRGMN